MKLKYKNNSIFLPKEDVCVVSDLHIGLEDILIEQGISFPFKELKYLKKNLNEVIKEFNPKKLIYNGDILHKFSGIPPDVPNKLKEIIKTFKGQHIFIRGSHDTMLDTVLSELGYEAKKKHELNNVAITHGNEITIKDLEKKDLLVIGHEHPAIEIHGEKKQCFLYQKNCYKETDILLLPSFSNLTKGVKINNIDSKDLMSPYLNKCHINNFQVIIETDDEVLKFPELGKFKQKL